MSGRPGRDGCSDRLGWRQRGAAPWLGCLLSGLLAMLWLATAVQAAPRPAVSPAGPATALSQAVLLISIDGMRLDYLDLGITPNLKRIAAEGVRAQWMSPTYPSLTFPAHYSIVTGLLPDHHGIIHNDMRDASRPAGRDRFRLSDRSAVTDGSWWGGVPVWVSVERAGGRSAAFYWPGSEAEIAGWRPQQWRVFDSSVRPAERVDQVLAWLADGVDFATLYFERVDEVGHAHGPGSLPVRQALAAVDAAIGRLLKGLQQRGLSQRVNLIVVSDHGMADVPQGRWIDVDSMVAPGAAELVSAGQVVGFNPRPGREAEAEASLLGRHLHHSCWRKAELPPRWRYGSHPRVPAIVCQMDEGWDALPRSFGERRPASRPRGSHGYDPQLPSMRTIFLAAGPGLRRGVVLPPIENIDVYPLLMQLLGLPAEPADGNAEALAGALLPESGR